MTQSQSTKSIKTEGNKHEEKQQENPQNINHLLSNQSIAIQQIHKNLSTHSGTPNNELSIKELKKSLYQKFQSNGILNNIKATVRTQLLHELTKQKQFNQPPSLLLTDGNTHGVNEHSTLFQRALNSLISEYLQTHNYLLTHSVFLPEAQLSQSNLLTQSDICSILRINEAQQKQWLLNNSTAQNAKENQQTEKTSLLTLIFTQIQQILSSKCDEDNKHMISTQTDFENDTSSSLVPSSSKHSIEKLLDTVDQQHHHKTHELQQQQYLQVQHDKLMYEKELNTKYQQQYHEKLEQYKALEFNQIRMAERERYTQQLESEIRKLQITYDEKYQKLIEHENEVKAKHYTYELQLDTMKYEQRQQLLQEMQRIQQKEVELQRSYELKEKEVEMLTSTWHEKHRLVDSKISQLEYTQNEVDARIESERSAVALKYESQVREKEETIKDLKASYERLQQRYDAHTTSYDTTHQQLNKLLTELHECQEQLVRSEHECKQLQKVTQEQAHEIKELTLQNTHYKQMEHLYSSRSSDVNVVYQQIDTLQQRLSESKLEYEKSIKKLKQQHQHELMIDKQNADDKLQAETRRFTSLLYEWQQTVDTLQHEIQTFKREEEIYKQQIDDLEIQLRQQKRQNSAAQQQQQRMNTATADPLNTSSVMTSHTNQLPVRPHTAGATLNTSFLNTSMPVNQLNTNLLFNAQLQPYTAFVQQSPRPHTAYDMRSGARARSVDESNISHLLNNSVIQSHGGIGNVTDADDDLHDRSQELSAELHARQQNFEKLEMEERQLKNEFHALMMQQPLTQRRSQSAQLSQHQHHYAQQSYAPTQQAPPPLPLQQFQPLHPETYGVQHPIPTSAPIQNQQQHPMPSNVTASGPSILSPQQTTQTSQQTVASQPVVLQTPSTFTSTSATSSIVSNNGNDEKSTTSSAVKSTPSSPAKKHMQHIHEVAKQKQQNNTDLHRSGTQNGNAHSHHPTASASSTSVPSRPHTASTPTVSSNRVSDGQLAEREQRKILREQQRREKERAEQEEVRLRLEAERREREKAEAEYAKKQQQPQPHARTRSGIEIIREYENKAVDADAYSDSGAVSTAPSKLKEIAAAELDISDDMQFPHDAANDLLNQMNQQSRPQAEVEEVTPHTVNNNNATDTEEGGGEGYEDEFQSLTEDSDGAF